MVTDSFFFKDGDLNISKSLLAKEKPSLPGRRTVGKNSWIFD